LGGQERPGKALKATQKKALKKQGVPVVWKSENVPGRVCPTIGGRPPRGPWSADLAVPWPPFGAPEPFQKRCKNP